MAHKLIMTFCVSALLVQSVYSACAGAPYGFAGPGFGYNALATPFAFDGFGPGLAYDGFGCGCGGVASTGGGLPCASSSPLPPVGVSVLSENVYEGPLAVGGNLPFLGTVALEGVLPTAGAGAVSYGCGSPVGIAVEEGVVATGIAPHAPGYGVAPIAPYAGLAGPYNGFGVGNGYGAYGCGCGVY